MILVQDIHFCGVFFVFERVFLYFFGNCYTLGVKWCRYLVLVLVWYHTSSNMRYAEHCNKAFPLGQNIVDFFNIKSKKNSPQTISMSVFDGVTWKGFFKWNSALHHTSFVSYLLTLLNCFFKKINIRLFFGNG